MIEDLQFPDPRVTKFCEVQQIPKAYEMDTTFMQLIQQFPHLALEIKDSGFSRKLKFAFVSSIRSGQYSPGSQLASEFLGSIQPTDVDSIRRFCCDLEWKARAEYADTFFQMLAGLARNPTRKIKDLEFEVVPAPGVIVVLD